MRTALASLLLAALVPAQDDPVTRQAARLAKQAKRHEERVKELWKTFVFTSRELSDKEIGKLVGGYEKAIDLYVKAIEIKESPGLNSVILLLSRRVAQARMVLMGREFQRRKPPPRPEPVPAEPPPLPARPPEKGDLPPDETPPVGQPPPAEPEPELTAPRLSGLPELIEPKAQRRRGIQGVRNFLMNHYLPARKFTSLVIRCSVCNGRGKILTGNLNAQRKIITIPCKRCHQTGYQLDSTNARKGFWLCHSPLYRTDQANQERWAASLAEWRADPRKIPEYLTTVRIAEVDYHGLWAELSWVEKGVDAGRRKFTREVQRKLVRAGKRWFFYDESHDKDFFLTGEE
jgi:hypothetical protein